LIWAPLASDDGAERNSLGRVKKALDNVRDQLVSAQK